MLLLITFFCILGVTLILGGLYVAFPSSTNILHFTFKALAPTACLFLALISANLASSFGGYTLFITLALAIIIALETFKCAKQEKTNSVSLVRGLGNLLPLILFAVAGIIVVSFNVWGLLMGLFLGLLIACISLIFKKLNLIESIILIANLAIGGLVLGQGIILLLSNLALGTKIIYFISAFLMLFNLVFSTFMKEDKVMPYIARTTRILALIGFAMSIYFMI